MARTLKNAEIAAAFEELATLYELDGAVVYRVLAYRNAAKSIRESGVSVAEMAAQGRAEELAGIGSTIAEKIQALVETGGIPAAEKLKAKIPAGLVEITRIPGLGPKRTRRLHKELGIESLDELGQAAEQGRMRAVPGFGARAEENVLAALAAGVDTHEGAGTHEGTGGRPRSRTLLSHALTLAVEILEELREHEAALRVELAGSARRWEETCKDLDIVAAASDPRALVEAFKRLSAIDEVTTEGQAGAKAITHQGLPVDLRIVPLESFGNLLQHFTGSASHNEALRTQAVKRGFHVSEYGVIDDSTGHTHACATEEEVYELLGMSYVAPELRENRGELAAAREGTLPALVCLEDVRGDLHCHTTASDGRQSIRQMAEAARERGYEYLAITDHSASHGFGNHVSPDDLRRQIDRVAEVDGQLGDFRVLKGSEVNVLPDGSLDYEDELLAELDWVIASVHTSFAMSEREMTDRMTTVMEHPLVDAIGHPTGRLIGRREGYALDVDRVIAVAAQTGTFLEINANPNRRDLSDVYTRAAVAAGVTIVVGSDAHGTETLANMRYGIATARRAWLSPENVANTRSWAELCNLRKR